MKQLLVIAAATLAACTFPPMNPPKQEEIPVSPAIEVVAPREVESPKEVKKRPKQSYPDCSAIQTGDPESDVRAKLDCIKENHT